MLKNTAPILLSIAVFICCSPSSEKKNESPSKTSSSSVDVRLSKDIVWEKLNPARGDQSPQAGTIWGNRKDTVATGFLAKFVNGFSSPPHIHNVTYRAVVIRGEIHNDDPQAANMWMGPGSFWTQPSGEPHITSAKGEENIAYVEIDSGPYLVKPVESAFEKGERPINISSPNIIWLDKNAASWIDSDSKAEISFLWENDDSMKGLFVRLSKGYKGAIETYGTVLHAVVISGEITYQQSDGDLDLDAGSYFSSSGKTMHRLSSDSTESIVYFRTNDKIRVK